MLEYLKVHLKELLFNWLRVHYDSSSGLERLSRTYKDCSIKNLDLKTLGKDNIFLKWLFNYYQNHPDTFKDVKYLSDFNDEKIPFEHFVENHVEVHDNLFTEMGEWYPEIAYTGNFLICRDINITYDIYEDEEDAERDIWYKDMEGIAYAVKIVGRNSENPSKIEWYWFIGAVCSC